MKSSIKLNIDKVGICASTVCAIHCLVTPVLVMAFPFVSLAFLEWSGFEIGILAFSFLLASTSLIWSYVRKHRTALPLVLAGIGFSIFTMAWVIPSEFFEISLSVIGGSFVAIAHFKNIRLNGKYALS